MEILKIFLLAGIFWGSAAGFGLISEDDFPEKGLTDNFWRKSSDKVDKLLEIRALSPFPKPPRGVQADVCYTEECLDASLALLRSINFSANPCENFYQFACGRWMAENPIPPSQNWWTQIHRLIHEFTRVNTEILTAPDDPSDFKPLKQAKQYYADCMNTDEIEAEGVAHLLAILTLDGGWPAITQNWTPDGFDLFSVVAEARRDFSVPILLNAIVSPDLKNTSRHTIYLDQPDFFLDRLMLLNPEIFKPRIDAYVDYFVGVAKELAKITETPVVESELIAQAKEIIGFETRLAEVSGAIENRTVVERTYNPYKLDVYQGEIDRIEVVNPHAKIDYKSVLDRIFLNSDVTIRPDEEVIVKEKEYLAKYIQILDTTDIKTIANYVHWRIVSGISPETTQVFRELQLKFFGLAQPSPREEVCAITVHTILGLATGVKYVQRTFDDAVKANVNVMVENVRMIFKGLLDEIEWMDEETRANAHEKASAMRQFLAYPDWLFNQTRVEQEYEGLEVESGHYLRTFLAIKKWTGLKQYKNFRKDVDKEIWIAFPAHVTAFYNPEVNSINLMAGFLQPPFYRIHGPECINYGAIGTVIGHELTHGFDNKGSQYDAEGNAKNWWSEEVLGRFQEKAQCFIDQYSGYETTVGNVNGNLTLKENIADNGGVRQSYFAYRNWVANNNGGQEEPRLPGLEEFTPDQLFFLGQANALCENISDEALANNLISSVHSPYSYRVIGSLQNFDKFSEKWTCPKGSGMNPDHKCVLW